MSKKILLNEKIENEICELSKVKSQKEIGLLYGRSQSFINGVLKKNNVKNVGRYRLNNFKLKVDESFFENIDNNDKAYWLGYLVADGNISKNLRKCTLVSKDIEIIEKFKKDVNSDHKISVNKIIDKRTGNLSINYSIQITNRIFVSNLINHGVTINKSDEMSVPKIDDKFLSYFFAGLFDGDGCISYRNNNLPRISLISTKEILLFLQNYLLNNFSIKQTKLRKKTENKKNVWELILYKDSILFLNWIYKDKKFNYLTRKYEKYINFIH